MKLFSLPQQVVDGIEMAREQEEMREIVSFFGNFCFRVTLIRLDSGDVSIGGGGV